MVAILTFTIASIFAVFFFFFFFVFFFFYLQVTLILLTKFQVNWSLSSKKKFNIDFHDGGCSGHLGFPIETILDIFDLQTAPILPTKFWDNWPFGSREEAQDKFSRWRPWRPSWISNRNDFRYLWSSSHHDTLESNNLSVQEKKGKINFQDSRHGGHPGLSIRTILGIFYLHVGPIFPTKFRVSWPFGSGDGGQNIF